MRIFTETEQLQYEDVAIGEVWVAGGQSNMEFWMRYEKYKEEAMKAVSRHIDNQVAAVIDTIRTKK